MKNLIRKIIALTIAVISTLTLFVSLSGCEKGPAIDTTKSQLYVATYGGGVGSKWLYTAMQEFEELHKDTSFEPGKKGVQFIEDTSKSDKRNAIASSEYNVFFLQAVNYNDLASAGLLLDITDVVTEVNTDGKTIESKLDETQKQALTAFKNKYYAIPHYEFYPGISYDVDLFDRKKLFYSKTGGWTNLSGDLSCGPDGISGTYDDGLPSSHEEFFNLCDRMLQVSVTPFVLAGKHDGYGDFIPMALIPTYCGADEFMLNFTFDSTKKGTLSGEELITTEIITGWNGNTPIIQREVITPQTGYLTSMQAAKYYGLKFLERMLSTPSYMSDTSLSTQSHLKAQEAFIMSDLQNKPIGMIIDGSYWYNEAEEALIFDMSVAYAGKDAALGRRFSFMPLPSQISGTVTEGNGKKLTLADEALAYAFINANIANDTNKVKLAKEFLKFCYTDINLQKFTVETGMLRPLKYELTPQQYNSMDYYYRTMYDIRMQSDVCYAIADSPIYINKQSKFLYQHGIYFTTTINNRSFICVKTAFEEGFTAKQYFDSLRITEDVWTAEMSEYFN